MPGLLPHSPAKICAKLLVTLNLATTPATPPANNEPWPAYYDNSTSSPNNNLLVSDTTSKQFRKHAFGERNEHYGIQVMIRSGSHDPGWLKANLIYDTLERATNDNPITIGAATVGGTSIPAATYCVRVVRCTSGVMRLGPEQNSTQRKFTVNVLVYIVKTA